MDVTIGIQHTKANQHWEWSDLLPPTSLLLTESEALQENEIVKRSCLPLLLATAY
jgi:hypothetical protein